MSQNFVEINSNKSYATGDLTGASSSTGIKVPSRTIGVLVTADASTDIDIEVSNDGTNWYIHPDATAITTTSAVVISVPFIYIRATQTGAGTGSVIFTW